MTAITVAICTYQRGDLLTRTLDSLVQAVKPNDAWELLIVDNEGSDVVAGIVEKYSKALPIRLVVEPVTGTAFARNRAINEAQYPIVLFTDDDAIVDSNWLVEMHKAIGHQDACDFWGGAIQPEWGDVVKPSWFDDSICPMLRDTIVQYNAGSTNRGWIPKQDTPFYTCNLALRVRAVHNVGSFDTSLGDVGKKRVGGEDVRLVETLAQTGSQGWYVATAFVKHPVPAERATKRYALSFARRQGWLSSELLARDHGGQLPRWAYRVALTQLGQGLSQWISGALRRNEKVRFAGAMNIRFAMSKLSHGLGILISRRS